jgi:hypothetical protein
VKIIKWGIVFIPANLAMENILITRNEIIPLFYFSYSYLYGRNTSICVDSGEEPLAAVSGVEFAISPVR